MDVQLTWRVILLLCITVLGMAGAEDPVSADEKALDDQQEEKKDTVTGEPVTTEPPATTTLAMTDEAEEVTDKPKKNENIDCFVCEGNKTDCGQSNATKGQCKVCQLWVSIEEDAQKGVKMTCEQKCEALEDDKGKTTCCYEDLCNTISDVGGGCQGLACTSYNMVTLLVAALVSYFMYAR